MGEDQYNVLIIDQSFPFLSKNSASYNEYYRLHLGFYFLKDVETAEQCLKDAIAFAREFPGQILGKPGELWRQGMHYVMSNSLLDVSEAKVRALRLKEIYTKLIEEDPENKVFGEPEDFVNFVYEHGGENKLPAHIAPSILFTDKAGNTENIHVALAIQTPESQIDIYEFRRYLLDETIKLKKVNTLLNHRVLRIFQMPDSLDYFIEAKDAALGNAPMVVYRASAIVNCAADGIAQLERDLGYFVPDNTVIRKKRSLLVKLPPSLFNMRSCIFSIGPHCSVANLSNGTAVLTYEPVTAASCQKESELRADITAFPRIESVKGEGAGISKHIIDGVAKYIPEMIKAQPLEIRVEYTRTCLLNNSTHGEFEIGVGRGLCYVSNTTTKMTHAADGAKIAIDIIENDFYIKKQLLRIIGVLRVKYNIPAEPLFGELKYFLFEQMESLPLNAINGDDEKLRLALAPVAEKIIESLKFRDNKRAATEKIIGLGETDSDAGVSQFQIKPSSVASNDTRKGFYGALHKNTNSVLDAFYKVVKDHSVSFSLLSQEFQDYLRANSLSYKEIKKNLPDLILVLNELAANIQARAVHSAEQLSHH